MCPMLDQIKFERMHGTIPPGRLEVGKLTSYVLNQAWSRVRCSVCNVVGGPSKLCIRDLNTSHTTVPIHIFGLPKCIYIIPLTDNEGYVLAMNGFLLVCVRAGQRHMSF